MVTLKGERLQLRALEPEDLEFILQIENDENIWEVSQTQEPYSRFVIKEYLENSFKDIYEVKQLRLVVATLEGEDIGLIDLFDFDPRNNKVGVGVLILDKERGKNYASEAMNLLLSFAFKNLRVHQIYANVLEDNEASIRLFEKVGFKRTCTKKDWVLEDGVYKNELLFQLIKSF
ncbi:GNAT family N-acetyltransferase [Pseudofulvibacter geojedonensis]|uniref:GNAT family N-acetyltransferase n=1 Tax=Pseudofulvibacter geojedonensis TaxID=1123758 RepID=A0ABW3HZ57_9FLAO